MKHWLQLRSNVTSHQIKKESWFFLISRFPLLPNGLKSWSLWNLKITDWSLQEAGWLPHQLWFSQGRWRPPGAISQGVFCDCILRPRSDLCGTCDMGLFKIDFGFGVFRTWIPGLFHRNVIQLGSVEVYSIQYLSWNSTLRDICWTCPSIHCVTRLLSFAATWF